jgi:hypothetical protein
LKFGPLEIAKTSKAATGRMRVRNPLNRCTASRQRREEPEGISRLSRTTAA